MVRKMNAFREPNSVLMTKNSSTQFQGLNFDIMWNQINKWRKEKKPKCEFLSRNEKWRRKWRVIRRTKRKRTAERSYQKQFHNGIDCGRSMLENVLIQIDYSAFVCQLFIYCYLLIYVLGHCRLVSIQKDREKKKK